MLDKCPEDGEPAKLRASQSFGPYACISGIDFPSRGRFDITPLSLNLGYSPGGIGIQPAGGESLFSTLKTFSHYFISCECYSTGARRASTTRRLTLMATDIEEISPS